jgi:ABC-2 type transport system permease protein
VSITGDFDRGDARIVDRTYRRYEGERGGIGTSIRATARHSIERSLGLKRTVWQKILPVVSIAFAYIPAIVFVGVVALIPERVREDNFLPSYAQYYGYIIAALVLFMAFVAPEILCTDRRSGMLGLYLASPLDRNTYLLAKAMAITTVLAIVTVGPLMLMLIANTILGNGPNGFDEWMKVFIRILAGGLGAAGIYTALSMCVSSFTSRRAAASATIVLTLLASSAVARNLVENGGASPSLLGFELFSLPREFVIRVFGEASDDSTMMRCPTGVVIGANLGWTAIFSVVTWWRYRGLRVTK